jgi:hypothetical protein
MSFTRIVNTSINTADWAKGAQGVLNGGPAIRTIAGVVHLNATPSGQIVALRDSDGRQLSIGLHEIGLHIVFNGQSALTFEAGSGSGPRLILRTSSEIGDNPTTSSTYGGLITFAGANAGQTTPGLTLGIAFDPAQTAAYLSVEVLPGGLPPQTLTGDLYVSILALSADQAN